MKTFNKMRNEKGEMRNCFFSSASLVLSAFCFLLSSCSQDEVFEQDSLKDTPITIASAGVAELTTRVITDDNKLEGITDGEFVDMSVFVTGGTADKYNATNLKWEHDGTSWNSETNVLYEGASSTQKIYACSPYTIVTDNNITVTATDQTDWLVATATNLTSSAANLTMTHALTKLKLELSYGSEVAEEDRTTRRVDVWDMYRTGNLNIANNTWSELSKTAYIVSMINNEALVIPMNNCTSFPIVITMEDARVFKTTINCPVIGTDANGENIYGLAPGTQYSIALQIGQDKVTLGGINAEPWVPSTGGVLETE